MPLFEQLLEYFVEVEKQKFIEVDGQRYDNIFIKVLVVANMMFLPKFTGRGGGCAKTTHFCMFRSCINKFRHEGEPGGCDGCRSAGTTMRMDFNPAFTTTILHLKRGHDNNNAMRIWNRY